MLLLILEFAAEEVGRAFRLGSDCSFDGGVGAGEGEGSVCRVVLSPSGPRGSKESSRASSRVGCASTRRGVLGVRGPRLLGDFGAVDAERVLGVGLLFELSMKQIRVHTASRYFLDRIPCSSGSEALGRLV